MLEFFKPPEGSLSRVPDASCILIPRLLHFDQDEHVLVISDLGPLETLSSVVARLSTAVVHPEIAGSQHSKYYNIGSRLGQFMGDLHSPERILLDTDTSPSDLTAKRDVELKWAVKPIEQHLVRYDIPDATELYRRVLEDFERTHGTNEQSFALGDLTPSAILVGTTSEEPIPLGVIDWEFAGRGRGMDGDMAQVLAQIHAHLIAHETNSYTASLIQALVNGITTSYRNQRRRQTDTIWSSIINLDRDPSTPPPPGPITRMLRSSFILHGREIINAAFDLQWQCECCDESQKEKCALIKLMVDRGIWYLRTAGINDEAFLQKNNWTKICAEENRVLTNMVWADGS